MTRTVIRISIVMITSAACWWLYMDAKWKAHTRMHLELLNGWLVEQRQIDNHYARRLDAIEREIGERR